MNRFDSDNQLWTEFKTFLAAMASATCMTDGEKLYLSGIHARVAAASTVLYGYEKNYVISKFVKLLTVKEGSND